MSDNTSNNDPVTLEQLGDIFSVEDLEKFLTENNSI